MLRERIDWRMPLNDPGGSLLYNKSLQVWSAQASSSVWVGVGVGVVRGAPKLLNARRAWASVWLPSIVCCLAWL
jgi:hypothetical protein